MATKEAISILLTCEKPRDCLCYTAIGDTQDEAVETLRQIFMEDEKEAHDDEMRLWEKGECDKPEPFDGVTMWNELIETGYLGDYAISYHTVYVKD